MVIIYLLGYVDDTILTGSDDVEVYVVTHFGNAKFSLKYLGLFYYFMGMEVNYLPNGDVLHIFYIKNKVLFIW